MKSVRAAMAILCAGVAGVGLGIAIAPTSAQTGTARMTEEQYNRTLPPDIHPDSRSRMPMIKRETLDDYGKKEYDRHVGPNQSSLAGLQGPGGLRLHGSKPDRIGEDLGPRAKELIRLIVSRELNQAFEWTVHEPVALKEKLEPATIDIIRHRKSLTGVPEKDAAMIQLGREYFQDHKVSSSTYARALKALGEKNLIDMCVLMGDYTETAVLLTVNDARLPYDLPSLLPLP